MAEYIDKSKIPWVKVDSPNGKYWARIVFESTINDIKPANVIERSKIDQAKTNIEIMLKQEKQADGTYTDVGQGIAIALGLLKNEIGE